MNVQPFDIIILNKFGPYTLLIGVLLIVLGTAGILLPGVMSLGTAIFVGWLLLIGGFLWAINTYNHSQKNIIDWLKPALLVIIGAFVLFYPVLSVGALGILMALYLLLDAMHSFALARSIYPAKGWGWMTINGVISALLATLFLIGWPSSSLWLVGLYVGISLLFDGWALVAIGWTLRK